MMREIKIYGEIGTEVRPEMVMHEFEAAAAGEDVLLRIHSPGGSVFDGLAMLGHMRQHRSGGGKVIAQVDGVAFSMAAMIALQADELRMHGDGYLMFHEARVTAAQATSATLRTQMDLLDTINAGLVIHLAEALPSRFPGGPDQVAEELKDEIWLTGADLVAAGRAVLLPERAMAAYLDPADYKALPDELQAKYPTWCENMVDGVTDPVTKETQNSKGYEQSVSFYFWA